MVLLNSFSATIINLSTERLNLVSKDCGGHGDFSKGRNPAQTIQPMSAIFCRTESTWDTSGNQATITYRSESGAQVQFHW